MNTFPSLSIGFLLFFGIIFPPFFHCESFLLLFLTLFDDDDNNYLIAKYLLELRSVTISFVCFSSVKLYLHSGSFSFYKRSELEKRTLDSVYGFPLSTEIFTLYSMKLLLELSLFSLFAVLEIHRLWCLTFFSFLKLSSLSVSTVVLHLNAAEDLYVSLQIYMYICVLYLRDYELKVPWRSVRTSTRGFKHWKSSENPLVFFFLFAVLAI